MFLSGFRVSSEMSPGAFSRPLASGGGGIRTHGQLALSTVFKTVPINHSGTPPSEIKRRGGERTAGARPAEALVAHHLVEDVVGDQDRHIHRHGQRNPVDGPRVDFDELAVVPNTPLPEIR